MKKRMDENITKSFVIPEKLVNIITELQIAERRAYWSEMVRILLEDGLKSRDIKF